MSLLLPNPLPLRHKRHLRCSSSSSPSLSLSDSLDTGVKLTTEPKPAAPYDYSISFEQTKDRIRKLFDGVQLSVSSYDTAWVALIPSPDSSGAPFFPECIDWLLNNQLSDGSWGRPHHHPLLTKDVLSSTLASVLALKRWGVGGEQINKGLHFIESNITSAIDSSQYSPIGFDVIFTGMVEYARNLDLNPPFDSTILDALLQRRELHLRRVFSEGRKSYLAYISEGLGKIQDWEMVMKYQGKNGSLFNSPSTTAAAFMHLHDAGCLSYLRSLLDKFGNAVPTVYPLDVYLRLCLVDNLQSLGIERHFRKEIVNVLDETYRYWLQGEEEIFLDSATCAIAFRLLRLNGYDVSSDPLTKITERESEFRSPGGHPRDIGAALELYRASEIIIYPDELTLEKQHSWSSHFLKQKFYNGTPDADGLDNYVNQEVDEALKFPFYANLNRVASRRRIEHYSVDGTRILKTSFCSSNIKNEDFLKLAVEDFNICQSIHREEVKEIERWVVEYKLDQLKFARQKSAYCYFSAAAALFSPELSYARISWAKNGVLTTVVDDFFDVGGSIEELENLIQLVEKWDVNVDADCCSENVRIIFSAIHSTISEIGARAFPIQGRDVTGHVTEIWLDLLNSMLTEARWDKDETVPTMDEYMSNGYVSFALGPIVLPALYLVGPKLAEEVARSSEYRNLFQLMSTCGRLLNDINGFERESKQGKLNALSLHAGGRGAVSGEEVVGEMRDFVVSQRRELLRLVLQKKGSQVPQALKDCFWKMSEVLHLFYRKDDGFTSGELMNSVKAIIYEPVARELQGE